MIRWFLMAVATLAVGVAQADGYLRLDKDFSPTNIVEGETVSPFAGKKIAFIGDSYVQNHRRPITETWHYRLAEKFGMHYYNYGRNGNCIVFANPRRGAPIAKRFGEIPRDVDYLVVIAGHNDACDIAQLGGQHSIPDPTAEQQAEQMKRLAEFKAGLAGFIDGLRKRYPRATLVFVTPWAVERPFFAEVIAAIKEETAKAGVACYDAASLSDIDPNDADFRKRYFQGEKDTAHLTYEGHGLMLEKVEGFFGQLQGPVDAAHLATNSAAVASWTKGMDDDAGLAAATSVDLFALPGAETAGQATTYPIRDRLYTQSLDGTWNFKLIEGLTASESDWISGFAPIEVPGNWETQGFRNPTYGNQMPELSGLYTKTFRLRQSDDRYILRFGGVLFAYKIWLNGAFVGQFGSAFQPAQWDVTDKLVDGMNELRVQVLTRSRGWLFDTNDCWALAGIFRTVELYTVPKRAAVEAIDFRYDGAAMDVAVKAVGEFAKVYASLVDEDGRCAADVEMGCMEGHARDARARVDIATPHLWSPDDPYLYDLVVTLVDQAGKKIQRVSQKVGLRTVRLEGTGLLINGKKTFLNGVAWSEIDAKEGRAITYRTRREQMVLMKKAGVNCIRTAHYPFASDFYDLADEMGFFVIDEVPFGSRGRVFLHDERYRDELLARTRNTILRDRNRASVIFWTFGNENAWTKNTAACLALAKEFDPTRPRGLPQIGSSQFLEMLEHPERDVDFLAGHYLDDKRMTIAEEKATKPLIQTEFAHACGNGFCDFERPYLRMRRKADKWIGGCVWAWQDQCVMHPDAETTDGLTYRNQTKLPKDLRRDLPLELQGNWLDKNRFLDSWGDRGTDGLVYGDGTPKDGYWLVKRLYRGISRSNGISSRRSDVFVGSAEEYHYSPSEETGTSLPRLRIGRRMGLDQRIQSLRQTHNSCQQPYLVAPEVQTNGLVRYYLSNPADRSAWLEGTVVIRDENDKTVVTYDLKPNDVAREREMLEIGLAFEMPAEATRVDWQGLGPLTAVPGKNRMTDYGVWAMHKDDYRFIGPRAEIAYALTRQNGDTRAIVLESGTGKVSFENVDGTIVLTECVHVAGYGGKNGPSGTRKLKALEVKGEVRLYETRVEVGSDVVPDLTYERHYGF